MAKKRITTLILSAFLGICACSFANVKSSEPVETKAEETKQAQLAKIDWNNRDYSYTIGQEWCGETNDTVPVNGYCLLAFFNEVGKTYQDTVIGEQCITGRGVIGNGVIDDKIKVNGVNIIDVVDSKCYIFPQYGLFFYIPETSITYSAEYLFPVISLEAGIHFNDVYLPSIDFEFRGELGDPDCWTYIKDPSEYNHVAFTDVAGGWNNVAADSNHSQTILQFGQYEVDYLKSDKKPTEANLVSKFSYCGLSITVNGVTLAEIGDANVSYAHGYCYVFIVLPNSVLKPSNGYKVCNLHFEDDTIFYDTMLGEVDLYLFNGEWVKERPETPEDIEYDNALALSDVFEVNNISLDDATKSVSGGAIKIINNFDFFFDYKLPDENCSFSMLVLGSSEQNGIKLVFSRNKIMVYDSTDKETMLKSVELPIFEYDEWYSILLYTKVANNNLSICVAVDDIVYIHLNNVSLANTTKLGYICCSSLLSGTALLKEAHYGSDNKKPILSYTGKAVYGVLSGSDKIDFSNKTSAYDLVDGDVTSLIEYNWPEDSLTENKINKGTWKVNIVSIDESGNKAQLSVTVIASDKLDVTVTFDGKDAVTYKIGDHIVPVKDPVKKDETGTYKFVGWYYNEKPWDFENDYIVQDMNLTSKFQLVSENYAVTFTVEGLDDSSSFTMFFAKGTTVSVDIFNRSGYTLEAYVNDAKVEYFTVNENMNVKLVYKSNNQPEEKKGCGGSIVAPALIISVLSGALAILLVSSRKKGGKEHE